MTNEVKISTDAIITTMQLCGQAAAISDYDLVGSDYETMKEALRAILQIHQTKFDGFKDHFIAGYLEELSRRSADQPNIAMAEGAFDSLLYSIDIN